MGEWRWKKKEIIYLSLHCHHQNDSCIKVGSDESHFTVSLIVRDKVTRQRPQTTTFFQEKGEPQWNQTEALLFISLTPYRWAKLAHHHPVCLQLAYTGKFRACWLINALDCKPSHQGFDSWMRQVEGLFFTSSQSRCVQTHKFLACLSNAQHAL